MHPTYVTPPKSGDRSTTVAIAIAIIAGLLAGGILFYRLMSRSPATPQTTIASGAEKSTATPDKATATTPDTRTSSAPAVVAEKKSRVPHRSTTDEVVPISSVDTPPTLITDSQQPQTPPVMPAPPPAAQVPAPAPETQMPPRRRAVQETHADSFPTPMSPLANAGSSQAPAFANSAPVPTANVSPAPPPPAPVKASYDGPMAGMATWTGKLEKNATLTITGGTASTGNLSGAGLPGVPVRIIVDQTNLGFLEMPNAANGYRKLVLKSHSSHDKITIHWTVVE